MVAYGTFIVLLFIVVVGFMTIVFSQMVNETIDVVNPTIEDGTLSTQYVVHFNLIVGLCKAIPIFAVIGVVAWGIVRALERRDSEGV